MFLGQMLLGLFIGTQYHLHTLVTSVPQLAYALYRSKLSETLLTTEY